MNRKKTIISGLCITSLLFAAGCSESKPKNNKIEERNVEKKEFEQEQILENKKMKINKVNYIKTENVSEEEKIVQISLEIKNDGKEEFGIGAGDFYIKDDTGNKYTMYSHEDNFGGVIPIGEKIQGNGYYKVPKNAKGLKLIYSPVIKENQNNQIIEWKLENIK